MAMATKSSKSNFDFLAILKKQKEGFSKDYDWLTNRLSDPDIETSELQTYIRSIRKNVTYLDRDYEILVGLLLKLNWASQEPSFVKEYQSFLVNLVSAHTYYLKAGLRMLVKHFSMNLLPAPVLNENGDKEVSIDVALRQKHDLMFVNIHLVLKAITQIAPMSPKVLIPLLKELLPFFQKDVYIQECYVKNLLQISHYIPNMRQKILEIVVETLIKFDVRSPRQEIEETQLQEEEDMEDDVLFGMDDPSVQSEVVSSVENGYSSLEPTPMTHKEAHKLDVLMDVMFKFIENVCHNEGQLNWEETKLLYRELLLVFENLIFPTHASCHVQFIMFYMCSLKQPICDGFLDYLWKVVQNPLTQPIYRQTAACYMGSLLSRGLFVSVSTVKTCLELMCTWIHKYLDQTGDYSQYADVAHHGPFFAVVQSVLYVFVFRNKDIFETRKGLKWSENLNFQRIVTSRLNPLKVCLPVIVQTFASVARSHQLAFCDTIIERNNRFTLPVVCSDSSTESGGKLLDTYFPFDPYILNRSGKYISPIYREYQGQIEEEQDSEENEEDDFIKEDIASLSNDKATIGSLVKSPTDFMEYGVSPGFKHFQDMT